MTVLNDIFFRSIQYLKNGENLSSQFLAAYPGIRGSYLQGMLLNPPFRNLACQEPGVGD
jgi:hypothetical protein